MRACSWCFSLQTSEIARKVLSFIHFTYGFCSLHGLHFWKLCQARRQQLTLNQAWEIGPQAWAGVRLKFSTRRRERHTYGMRVGRYIFTKRKGDKHTRPIWELIVCSLTSFEKEQWALEGISIFLLPLPPHLLHPTKSKSQKVMYLSCIWVTPNATVQSSVRPYSNAKKFLSRCYCRTKKQRL